MVEEAKPLTQGAKSIFAPVLAKRVESSSIQSLMRRSINGSIFLMLEKLHSYISNELCSRVIRDIPVRSSSYIVSTLVRVAMVDIW